jgi:hypothetical protein
LKTFEPKNETIVMQKTKFLFSAFAAVIVTCGLSSAHAAVLTGVPMQGGMAMPMISYHAADGHLHVMMPGEVPQLTPLLISNLEDSFDPGDPWYNSLDPSRQGLSFSRRYGFMMEMMGDPLPANTAIWLRKVTGPPELNFYRYAESAPKAWEPIFGTAGTTNALYWNGDMFHPGVTAPPGTNPITATFEAVLLNTLTGAEVANSSTGPMVLDFTNVSDGRPTLAIGQRIVVFYPTNATNWSLEGTDTLPNGTWTLITNAPVSLEGQSAVVLESGDARKFFRVKLAP